MKPLYYDFQTNCKSNLAEDLDSHQHETPSTEQQMYSIIPLFPLLERILSTVTWRSINNYLLVYIYIYIYIYICKCILYTEEATEIAVKYLKQNLH